MNTYIVPEDKVEDLREEVFCVKFPSIKDAHKTIEAFGYKPIELEEAKKQAKIGDCLLVEYDHALTPFQIVDKKIEDGKLRCSLMSYYLIEKQKIDDADKGKSWQDSSLRKHLNEDFIKKFNPEFANKLVPTVNYTGGIPTEDKVWIPSYK